MAKPTENGIFISKESIPENRSEDSLETCRKKLNGSPQNRVESVKCMLSSRDLQNPVKLVKVHHLNLISIHSIYKEIRTYLEFEKQIDFLHDSCEKGQIANICKAKRN